MFKLIFFIAVILLFVFIITLIAVGLCLGIAHLMIYFLPTIELVNALVPAAILTTVLIVVFGEMIKSWVGNAWQNHKQFYLIILMKMKTMNLSHRPSPETIQIVIIEIDAKNSSDLGI